MMKCHGKHNTTILAHYALYVHGDYNQNGCKVVYVSADVVINASKYKIQTCHLRTNTLTNY